MNIELYDKELQVRHFLKADSFGQIITVNSSECPNKTINLVEDTDDFFDHIYEPASGSLTIDGILRNTTIDQWLESNNKFAESLNCMLIFIEGYAGCGKSTLVQNLLYSLLENQNYDYSYYNYDIGVYPEDCEEAKEIDLDFIKHSILQGLKKQIIRVLNTSNGLRIFNYFKLLMCDEDAIKKLDASLRISIDFGTTKGLNSAVESLMRCKSTDKDEKIKDLKDLVDEQCKMFSVYQMLCIDYLWRLSQYLSNENAYKRHMFVCYDNLDNITNFDTLCNFKDQLIVFRSNLSSYISTINNDIKTEPAKYGHTTSKIRPFIIFSTYRKITAIRSNIRNTEMIEDTIKDKKYIKFIDVSKQYNFTKVAERRINHFSSKILTTNICGCKSSELIDKMSIITHLKEMTFVKTTYSGLWNNNIRACSNVLSDLIESNNNEMRMCIDLFDDNYDGHMKDKYCYYGASSLFLYSICKKLKSLGVFDENNLDLVNCINDTEKNKTSLSRLIITYLFNKNNSISITELFDVFDKMFEPQYICKILGQMMTRVEGEIWRRPIYYSKNALKNESDIANALFEQYRKHQNHEPYSYVEFRLCDCGSTYINSIVPQFEFYSVRIDANNQDLYCLNDETDLRKTIDSVYQKIKTCCINQLQFAEQYIEKYNLDKDGYIGLDFHPRTRSGNPQLHIERVIFSHIAYFNNYRMYLLKSKADVFKKFNDTLIEYISNYLDLYNNYVSKLSDDRKSVAEIMKEKVEKTKTEGTISIEV